MEEGVGMWESSLRDFYMPTLNQHAHRGLSVAAIVDIVSAFRNVSTKSDLCGAPHNRIKPTDLVHRRGDTTVWGRSSPAHCRRPCERRVIEAVQGHGNGFGADLLPLA